MDQEKTKVIFRKYKDTGQILALFPDLPSDSEGKFCTSYEHVGQHGPADLLHCINTLTVPAKPKEFAELKKELEDRGYNLTVVQTVTIDNLNRKKPR